MRWIPFIVLIYLVVIVQTTVGRVLTFTVGRVGSVGPDLMAIVAVFVALHVRSGSDAALAGWAAGLALDLTTAGGPGAATVIGPMPIAYALAAAAVFKMREAFFRERTVPQALLAMIFCLLAHGLWLTLQSLLARGETLTWWIYGRRLLQAALLAAYTGVLMPLGHLGLVKIRGWLVVAPAARVRRARR